jgi:hypothetical protein
VLLGFTAEGSFLSLCSVTSAGLPARLDEWPTTRRAARNLSGTTFDLPSVTWTGGSTVTDVHGFSCGVAGGGAFDAVFAAAKAAAGKLSAASSATFA